MIDPSQGLFAELWLAGRIGEAHGPASQRNALRRASRIAPYELTYVVMAGLVPANRVVGSMTYCAGGSGSGTLFFTGWTCRRYAKIAFRSSSVILPMNGQGIGGRICRPRP